jgi:hypothetical protein
MSSFFDDLEAQLAGAARAQTAVQDTLRRGRGRDRGRRARGRRWGATAARAVPVGLAVLTALAIAVLAVTLLHHARAGNAAHGPASPPPSSNGPIQLLPSNPNRTQRQEITYLYDAQEKAARRDQVCNSDRSLAGFGDPGRRPSLSQAAPRAATLAILGVLRRPAVASDKLPPRVIGAPPHQHVYPDGTIPPVKDVYIRYVRKARHRFGASYYVVPAGDVNYLVPVPARCFTEQHAALQRELPTIPARLRAGVLALEPLFVAQQRHNDLPYPGVCLIGINDTGNGGGGCDPRGSVSQIENGWVVSGGAPTGVEVYAGLAPGGVRSVTFFFHGRGRGNPHTALVINNVFILQNPRGSYGIIAKMVWRAADGRIIKVIYRP